jgi:SET domain-containing protein
MKRRNFLIISSSLALLLLGTAVLLYAQRSVHSPDLVRVNQLYETRTVVKKSMIPNAGNGLFAAVKINEGEVIGELGGRLTSADQFPEGNPYLAAIAECAWEKSHPYTHIDSKDHGGHVSRINFAPRAINEIETNFQNAAIKQLCEPPYVIFVATRDIEPGTEIWASYGPSYDYDRFMLLAEVRDFFCGLLELNCREAYTYSY